MYEEGDDVWPNIDQLFNKGDTYAEVKVSRSERLLLIDKKMRKNVIRRYRPKKSVAT